MNELTSWLILHHAPDIGPIKARAILEKFANPQELLESSDAARTKSGCLPASALSYYRRGDFSAVDDDIALLKESNVKIIHWSHADYPDLLQEIHDPPLVLYLRGNSKLLAMPQIAIVGSRNPDRSGRELAFSFAKTFAENSVTTTSGLAIGIDSSAHQGALGDIGSTIAVLGTGINRIYPARNRKLAHDIAEKGLLVTELPAGRGPKAENFPRRNRIISGLALGTLVIQAALKSGSLISARLASEQGREVFAIPGSIHNPLARGCHMLIKQGAKLVETTADIFEELDGMVEYSKQTALPAENNSEVAGTLLEFVEYNPTLIDDIANNSNMDIAQIKSELLELELAGKIEMLAGGRVQRI